MLFPTLSSLFPVSVHSTLFAEFSADLFFCRVALPSRIVPQSSAAFLVLHFSSLLAMSRGLEILSRSLIILSPQSILFP